METARAARLVSSRPASQPSQAAPRDKSSSSVALTGKTHTHTHTGIARTPRGAGAGRDNDARDVRACARPLAHPRRAARMAPFSSSSSPSPALAPASSSSTASTPRAPRQQLPRGASSSSSSSPVYLNVYDVTPANGYARWLGLGVYHSGVQGMYALLSSPSILVRHRRR